MIPEKIMYEVFKRHSHADIEFEDNPEKSVYTHESVIELINIALSYNK